jgi:hypothetical protein
MRRKVATHVFLKRDSGGDLGREGGTAGRTGHEKKTRRRSGEELLPEPARRDAERAGRIEVGEFRAAAEQQRLKPESQPNRRYKVFRLTRIITTPHTRAAPKQFQGPT